MLAAIALVCSCQQLQSWRDAQSSSSKQAAQSSRVSAPAQPVVIPKQVLDSLPVDPSMTFVSFSTSVTAAEVEVNTISAWSLAESCQWMLAWMQQAGYQSDDNPSRILEGLDFFSVEKNEYSTITLRLTVNTADQCMICITARN